MGLKPLPAIVALLPGLLLWFVIPPPEGVSVQAWQLLALFVGTVVAIVGRAMPIGALSVVALVLVAVTGVTSSSPDRAIVDALSGLANPIVWLIGVAIMISRGVIKTGLGTRLGYLCIARWGQKTLGIAYALAVSDLLLAPVTVSNTARGGAIIHPVMRAIAGSYRSDPEHGTQARMGRYLALANYHANPITSAMFITATAPNPLIVKLVADVTQEQISVAWGTWALAMLLPGLLSLAVMPLVLYWLYPPEIKSTPNAAQFAAERLREMGPLSRGEIVMLGVFAVLLALWAGLPALLWGDAWAVHPTTAAFIGLALLLFTGVLSWGDVLREKNAWDTILWFSALVMMASFLDRLGLVDWFTATMQSGIASLSVNWSGACLLLVLVYMYSHYFFASNTAHVTAMFAAVYGAGIALGAPALPFAFMLAAASSLSMALTHYATGTSPVIFGSGYTSLGEWWRAGFIMSVCTLIIWLVAGGLWWKLLGHW